MSCPNQTYIQALIARHLDARGALENQPICRYVHGCSSVRSICLKIVVSPVRVRVSPSRNPAWMLGLLIFGEIIAPQTGVQIWA
jgi:hypothetical protein